MPTPARQGSQKRRSSTRRQHLAEKEDYRPIGADGSKPPILDLGLTHKLKIIGLANILPLTAGTALFLGWFMGSIEFSIDGNYLLLTTLIMLAALVLVGSCWWVLFPFSVWLRRYLKWYYNHESKLVWGAPLACSWIFWFAMWVSCVALTLFALWLTGFGAWELIARPGEVT